MLFRSQAVIRLRAAGADVLIGTGIDAKNSPVLELTRSRTGIYNANIWSIARRHGAHVIDVWGMRCLRHWGMWHDDRLHFNSIGHERVSQAALAAVVGDPAPGANPDEGGRQHHEEPEDADGPVHLDATEQDQNAEHEPQAGEGGPAAVDADLGVAAQRVRELRVLSHEGRLKLLQQLAFLFRKRHGVPLSGCGAFDSMLPRNQEKPTLAAP